MTEKQQTPFTWEHIRHLREKLVWCFKKSPPMIQQEIHKTLLEFQNKIKDICQCEETAYVAPENKMACLNCGKRHDVPEDFLGKKKTDLKVVK